tara:strand:- start:15644 stop:16372 length:729 start_codon:yes stop_codon:yes gene_type:complete
MKNQITLISGAGRGIGEEIARRFYNEGHDLVLLLYKANQKKKLEKQFNKKRVTYFVGDLKNKKFIQSVGKRVKYVDNLVNNAGVANKDYFIKVKPKDLDKIVDINFKSYFLLSQIFAKKMIQRKIRGSIVSISSQLGHIGAFNRTAYCSTKFALEGFTKSAAMDLGKHGIRINTVAPTKTIVSEQERKNEKKRLNLIKKKIPLNRFSTTTEIASIVYFLTTDSAKSITGTSIISDGGWTCGK